MAKTPYSIYDAHRSEVLNDTLYAQIVEKARRFDVAIFQNHDLAKGLCDISLKPSNLSANKSKKLLKVITWLMQTRNNAQLSAE
ncbi:MAG: hypothetical protein GX780_07920 [Campylobacteraceae bacterium]|nr:hypothetical protein [Campylobacteraceae bacterium]